jgi:hypothetical protein
LCGHTLEEFTMFPIHASFGRPGWRSALLTGLAAACLSAPARAQDVELYDQPDFRGVRLTLSAATPDLAAYGVGGRVASVVVKRGQWEFCTQPQFGGACISVGPGPLRAAAPGTCAATCQQPARAAGTGNCRGMAPRPDAAQRASGTAGHRPVQRRVQRSRRWRCARRYARPAGSVRFQRHRPTSVEVRSGSWDLCNDGGFAGACLRLGPGRHLLPPGFRGAVSSVRPAPGSPSLPPTSAPVGAPALVLHEHSHFGGRQLAFQGPESRLDDADFNDTASAVEIFRGRWQLCEHIDFGGRCVVFGPGRHVLSGGFQDAVSSLRPVFGTDDRALPAGGGVTLHENIDFTGHSLLRSELTLNLADLGFNDRTSAIEVHGGQWELCGDAQFAGRCAVFRPGRHVLPDFLNNRVSSLRPR